MPALWRAHWVQAFEGAGPAGGWLWSSGRVFRCFCRLSRFVFGGLALNVALFRVLRGFLEGFPCWMYVCIASMLCVACVALYACGVRRIKGLWRVCSYFLAFPLLCLPFHLFTCFCPSPCLLCSGCLLLVLLHCLCGSLGVVVVSFSLTDYTQKERTQRFCPLCPLLSCCGLC